MAARVPVISSNAGGLPEINIPGQTGYMSNVGDVENMAANALKLLKDEALLEKVRQGAWEQAQRFHIDNIIPKYEALYEEVLQNQVQLL
jgi:glycosyltransferase involved in cell wall biosynthesis